MKSIGAGGNDKQNDTGNQNGSYSIMPGSVRNAMSLGGYLRSITSEPDESEMVDMLMEWFPERVYEYASH